MEFVIYAFIQDPELASARTFIYIYFAVKYICCAVMLYSAYHHIDIRQHHVAWLYVFAVIFLAVSVYFWWMIAEIESILIRFTGRGIENHPIVFDFIGFAACSAIGSVYLIVIACLKMPQNPPSSSEYKMIPVMPYEMQQPVMSVKKEFEMEPLMMRPMPIRSAGYQLIQLS